MDGAECLADVTDPSRYQLDANVVSSEVRVVKRGKRGEYAFSHPEWARPWRSASQQRQADELAKREIETEAHAQKNHILRRQLAASHAALKRAAEEQKADALFTDEERKADLRKAEEALEKLKEDSSKREMALRRQVAALQREKEDTCAKLADDLREAQRNLSRQEETHARALSERMRRSADEVASVRSVLEAKEKELQASEARHRKEAGEYLDKNEQSSASLLKQLHETDEHWRTAFDAQQSRTAELRKQDLVRIETLEQQLLDAKKDLAEANRKHAAAERKAADAGTSSSSWSTRVISQLDTMVNSFDEPAPDVTILPKDKPSNPLQERLWYRLLQLWQLVQASHLQRKEAREKWASADEARTSKQREESEEWRDRRRKLARLEEDVDDLRQRQARVSAAGEDVVAFAERVEAAEKLLAHRLKFFIDDAEQAESFRAHPASCPPPAAGGLCVVYASAHGVPLWSDKVMFRNAMDTLSSVIRRVAHARGGYEIVSKGDGYMFLFRTVADGCEFALDAQVALYNAKWPDAVLSHTDLAGPDSVWRGIRCRMAIHHGEVNVDATVALPERQYFGPALMYAAALLGKTAPGQILLSSSAWGLVEHQLDLLPTTEITSLGLHNVYPGEDGKDQDRLMQMLPLRFAGRVFPPLAQSAVESAGFQETLCDETRREVEAYHRNAESLRKGVATVTEELEEIGKMAIVCTGKLRTLQTDKPWKPEDMVSAYATIDELIVRHDGTRRSLEDVLKAQDFLAKKQQALEASLSVHNEGILTEAERRREIQLLKQRHQEQMHALEAQCKSEAQRLLLNVMKKDEATRQAATVSALSGLNSSDFRDTVGGRSGGYEGGSLAREPSGGRLAEGRGFDRHDSSMRGGGKALLRSSVNSSGNQPRGSAVKRGSAARWAARPTTPLQPQAHRFDSSRSLTSPLSRSGRDSVLGHVGFH